MFSSIYLLTLIIIQHDNSTDYDENNFDSKKVFILLLYSINFIVLLFLFILIFFQIKFITSNETTSENIRKITTSNSPFDNGFNKNLHQFFYDIEGYKNEINYSETSKTFIKSSKLLSVYFQNLNSQENKMKEENKIKNKNDNTILMADLSINTNYTSDSKENMIVEDKSFSEDKFRSS